MTDREFKRLNRAQLIDIIYELQLKIEALTEDRKKLETALVDKRLRISQAGSIAEAALEINNCLASAQKAADQYLAEIKALRAETVAECDKILKDARAQADEIVAAAKAKEYTQNILETGDSL